MIQLVYSKKFLKSAQKLPDQKQEQLAEFLEYMRENPYHSLLHTKQLSGPLVGFLSFRVGREWRVIFEFLNPETIQLLRVAHRKDIYR